MTCDPIWFCRGCLTVYAEYHNGCPRHFDGERKIVSIAVGRLEEA